MFVVFTTQFDFTVVDCHVSRLPYVAPGALRVIVGVTALVAPHTYFRDEVFVLAELPYLRRRPWQTDVPSLRNTEVAIIVYAIIW